METIRFAIIWTGVVILVAIGALLIFNATQQGTTRMKECVSSGGEYIKVAGGDYYECRRQE